MSKVLVVVLVGAVCSAVPSLADVAGVYQGTFDNPKQGTSVSVEGPLTLTGQDASGSLTLDPAIGAPFADTFAVVGKVHGQKLVLKGTGATGALLIWRAKQLDTAQGLFGGRMKVKAGKAKVKGTLTLQLLPPDSSTTTTVAPGPGETTTTTAPAPPSGQLFTQNCAVCHGAQAQGSIGPNIQCANGIASKVKNGGDAMPAFPQLTNDDIQAIQTYLAYLCSQ